ncbi:hypothetical protein PO124_23920 [Bacillus licheniformis]|nr:hypothetical protein [Bacillus licheniformis]
MCHYLNPNRFAAGNMKLYRERAEKRSSRLPSI